MISGTALVDGLHPVMQGPVRQLIAIANAQGLTARIISGYRSMAEQKRLYAQGRSWWEQQRRVKKYGKDGAVTDAAPGESAHNYGLAIDVDGVHAPYVAALARMMGFQPPPRWDPHHIEWPNWRRDFDVDQF